MQGAAQKGDVPAYGLSARKAGYGLAYDSLKNTDGDIFAAGAFVDKRLNIGFGEYAAARRNGINRRKAARKLV